MAALIIDGKAISAKVRAEAAEGATRLERERGVRPGLATVLVGDDPASGIYVRNKHKACEGAGFISFRHELPADTTEAELIDLVERLNGDPAVHGILVQLPLPRHLDELKVLDRVSPDKDVDGFHPLSAGRLLTGRAGLRPCTPWGVMRMLDEIGFDPKGRQAVVIGRSNIVGKPMALMLLERHATVTIAHSRTTNLPELCRGADLVVAAVGRARMVQGDWIKEGAVVIDVGMNRDDDGKLCGDVDQEAARARASAITPVPGGVGPMTIAMLLMNTLSAAERLTAPEPA